MHPNDASRFYQMQSVDCSPKDCKKASSSLLGIDEMELTEAFAIALRRIRLKQGLTQEDFAVVSSRTYLSSLERGTKKVSLQKTCELADRLGVHPLSLLAEAFRVQEEGSSIEDLLERVRLETADLGPSL
jgi:ribosome-binding protein aMBF1 (putative translation factor)